LTSWFDRDYSQSLLVYRGTRHGFDNAKFFSRCDNMSHLLFLFKSDHNKIFGGFTTVPVKKPDMQD
jgi:hypothetical protein